MSDLFWVHAAADGVADGMGRLTAGGTGAEALRDQNARLERRLERLTLLCQAMWTLVRDRNGVSEDDLARRVQELDLKDGKLDGRLAPGVACAACGRVSSRRHPRCLYCEAPRKGASTFDTV